MKSPLDARIEVARGEMVIGEVVVPFAPAGVGGEWQVGGVRGPTLRPLRFSERTRLAVLAATSLEPRACLGAAVARAATVVEGELAPLIRETAALLLCGARDGRPSFGEAVLRVARAAGWTSRKSPVRRRRRSTVWPRRLVCRRKKRDGVGSSLAPRTPMRR